MELTVETLPEGVRCVHLAGRLDMKGTLEIELKFTGYVAGGHETIIIDVAQVDYIASIGIRLLLGNVKTLNSVGAKMVLASPQPTVEEALKMAGLDSSIPMVPDIPAALEAVKQLKASANP